MCFAANGSRSGASVLKSVVIDLRTNVDVILVDSLSDTASFIALLNVELVRGRPCLIDKKTLLLSWIPLTWLTYTFNRWYPSIVRHTFADP